MTYKDESEIITRTKPSQLKMIKVRNVKRESRDRVWGIKGSDFWPEQLTYILKQRN